MKKSKIIGFITIGIVFLLTILFYVLTTVFPSETKEKVDYKSLKNTTNVVLSDTNTFSLAN